MNRPAAGGGQRIGRNVQRATQDNCTSRLASHLDAMAELSTVPQFADYLFWQSGTAEMQRVLLEYVPSAIRGSVWAAVMARYHEQRTGGQ